MAAMRIGELAQKTGCSTDALRLYEERGLLRSLRQDNGYRSYPAQAVDIVQVIRTAQRLGFTLAEIATHGGASGNLLQAEVDLPALFQTKAAMVQERIQELQQLRDALLARAQEPCPLREP
ncbi:MAG: MerR family transcriptional regulator [Rhodoferax sp.]